jgi:hypothetical protein
MTEALRPLNLGGILDRGVQIFRAQPLLFFGLGAFPGIAQFAASLASVHPKTFTDPNAAHIALELASYGASIMLWVAKMVFQSVATAAICLATSKVNLGESITVRSALGAYTSKAGRLVGLSILQGIYAGWPLIILIPVALFVSDAARSSALSIFVLAPVYVLGAIPCIALYTGYALAFPATAIENLPAQSAIVRSVQLGEGGRWAICWGFLVPIVPAFLFTAGAAALIELFRKPSQLLAVSPLAVAGINGIVELIATLVFTPYSAIVLTLLYYDQRIRREGFDVERMMDAAGLNPTSSPQPIEASIQQTNPEPSQS